MARVAAQNLGDLRLAYSDQETGVRGFVLTGSDVDLTPYNRGIEQARRALGALTADAAGRPALVGALSEVAVIAERWRSNRAEPQIAARRAGTAVTPEALDAARADFDALRSSLDRTEALLVARLDGANERALDAQRLVVLSLLAAFAVVAACGLITLVLFRRWIDQPLGEIADAARRIGRGEHAAVPAYPIAELDDVSTAVDFLQSSLSAERDRAVRAYEALEQSAVLALRVRAGLAGEGVLAPAGWSVSSALRPAEGIVAGDCFDLGLVDPRTLYVVMIDVTGHGAVAALLALQAKAQVRAAVKSGLPPGRAMGWLAQQHDDARGDLLTAFVATIDIETGACRYANAGHPPGLVVTDGSCLELERTGPLVGAFDDATWGTATTTVPNGATLVLHTDGVTEACGAQRARFGEDRLRALLLRTSGESAGTTVAAIVNGVDAFRVGALTDDVTVVALRRAHVGERVATPADREATDG